MRDRACEHAYEAMSGVLTPRCRVRREAVKPYESARDCHHGQPSRTRPATKQTAPATAQNVLPVIDDPWIRRVVPCPIQTRPVRHNTAPRTRRTTITKKP